MKKNGFLGVLILLIVAAVLGYSVYARYQNVTFPSPFGAASSTTNSIPPKIFSIDPTVTGIGQAVVISGEGFQSNNNLIHFGSYTLGTFSSSDGNHLTFDVPASLNTCRSPFCLSFVYHIEPGEFPIFVENEDGISNTVVLNVNTATPPPNTAVPTYP